ncbi:hypothetical protein PRNP1_010647 [Phytophthora ramorum]|uniref:uncharacterized protein n=1 Tax=Phytophthora ramorum TaxID=164328 RepID=UPI0030B07802|nr:hypothetical protein KRP23_5190 [Phytophthora ramorum]
MRIPAVMCIVVTILLLTFLANSVSAWNATVTFYKNAEFEGSAYAWGITETQLCYNLSCFDNKASSVKWTGLPETGSFDGKSRIAFFTGKDCTGDHRDWPTDGVINGKKDNYPMDFTLDGIDDSVSSFVVWEDNKKLTNGKETPCPWATT